jgi:hypothetical protein
VTETEAPWEPRPAYPELHALAAAMRPTWNATELRDAMTAAHQAGWPWKDVYREVMRLAWAEEETPATLRNSARRPGPAPAAPLDPRLKAALFADLAARRTGGQPVLTDDYDSQGGAA